MYTPIDMKRSTKYGNNYWESYSPKLKRIVKFFSDLEYDNWILVETNFMVKGFCEQPLKINYFLEGEIIESILDMWVYYQNGAEEFNEVKYSSELDPNNPKASRSIRQTTVQKLWCQENNYKYGIKTEEEIRGNPVYLSNMKQILSHVKVREFPIETDRKLILNLLGNDRKTLGSLVKNEYLPSIHRGFEAISWLIYEGYIKGNLDERLLDFETEVWVNGEYKNY